MKILDKYLLKRMVAAMVKTALALVLIVIMIDLLTHRRGQILRYDVPWYVVLRYYAAFTPEILVKYQAAALSVLISALLVLGQAAQHNEIVGALSGGISLRRIVRMPVLAAFAAAVLLFVMQETVGAAAARDAGQTVDRYFSKTPYSGREGVDWANLSSTTDASVIWTCHIEKFNRIAHTGEGVLIYTIGSDAFTQIEARRIFWDETQKKWLLEDGLWLEFHPGGEELRTKRRITQLAAPFDDTPSDLFAWEESPDAKTARQLARDLTKAELRRIPVHNRWVYYHAKFSQPALCFVMIWLAIPFAMRLRRGGIAVSFGVSLAIAVTYLAVFSIGMLLGDVGRLSPLVAAWLANGVFLAVGLFLFCKTPT